MNRAGILAAALFAIASPSSAQEGAPAAPPASTEREAFDLSDVAQALENGRGSMVRAAPAAERAQTLDDRLRRIAIEHINANQCWRTPSNAAPQPPVYITVQFELNADGSLRGEPRVTEPLAVNNAETRRAIEHALRAVRRCSPYPFPAHAEAAGHYDHWREIEFTFRTLTPQAAAR